MKKTIRLTEEQLLGIIERVISEQTACQWENYVNGDGINKPKITVKKSVSGVIAVFVGPETGFCIQHLEGSKEDSIHQLAGVVRKVVSSYLKELYSQGNFVYPDLDNIEMVKNDKFFGINVPFVSTTEDKAITNFNERGGWGHDGKSTLNKFLSTISDPKKYDMIKVVTKVASGGKSRDITENWVSFRDIVTYPIKITPSPTQEEPQFIEINATDLDDLEKKFTIIDQKEKYKLTDIKISSVSPNRSEVNMSYNKVKDPNGNTGFFLFFTPTDATGSDLQLYNDTLSEKMNLVQQPKIIREGLLNWLGSEFNYVIVGHN
jgi:hypothetical protein